jgi:hypothetical protein
MFRTKRSLLVVMAASVMAFGSAACGDDDPAGPVDPVPTAGTLTVTLSTPNVDDGAILLVVTGPDMTQVTTANPALYFRYSEAAGQLRAVFVGNIGDGALLSFRVPDVDAVASYVPTIVELADRDNQLRDSAGYQLTVD